MKNKGKVVLSGERTRRDFLYIDDFCRLVENVLKGFPKGYNLYNIGSGSSYTLKHVTKTLGKLLDKKISISYDRKIRTGDVIDMVADISKASSDFNWKPHVSLEQGLQHVVNYLMK
jgi:nucleoside-diphosphate-sugar epimerase